MLYRVVSVCRWKMSSEFDYDFDPIHLRTHEVNYELRIRNVASSTSDMSAKRKFLRRELRKDMMRPGVIYETPNFSFESEKAELNESLKGITELVNDFDGMNEDVCKRIRSRLKHILGRARRIPEGVSEEVSGYRGDKIIAVTVLEEELDDIVERYRKGAFTEPNNAATNDFALTQASSKYIPIHKWSLTFDGSNSKFSVNAFLERIEELGLSRNTSKQELFNSAVELFAGPALVWFRQIRSRIHSWDDLVTALRRDFLPADFNDELWSEIRGRTQGQDERVTIYIATMENLFGRLTVKASDEEKLRVIRKNLLPCYQVHLALQDITSIERLADVCRILENANLVQKKFRSPASRNISALEPDLAYSASFSRGRFADGNGGNNRARDIHALSCWNCKEQGHVRRDCPKTKRYPYCFGCGEVGIIKPNCLRCRSKNARGGGAQ